MDGRDGEKEELRYWDTDRPAGFLTPEQREFIWEFHEHNHHSKKGWENLSNKALRQRRYRIRKRARNALADFYFLSFLPNDDIEIILEEFQGADSVRQVDWDGMGWGSVHQMLRFLYQAMDRDVLFWVIENALAAMIEVEYMDRGEHANVELEITTEMVTTSLDLLKRRFDEKEELSDSEIESLVYNKRITQEEADEYVAQREEG